MKNPYRYKFRFFYPVRSEIVTIPIIDRKFNTTRILLNSY